MSDALNLFRNTMVNAGVVPRAGKLTQTFPENENGSRPKLALRNIRNLDSIEEAARHAEVRQFSVSNKYEGVNISENHTSGEFIRLHQALNGIAPSENSAGETPEE